MDMIELVQQKCHIGGPLKKVSDKEGPWSQKDWESALTPIIFTICLHIGKYVKCICISRGQYFLRFHSSTYDLELRNSLCHGLLSELHCTIRASLFVLKTTQVDWSPFVSSLWRACSNPCQKYVGENDTTIYFMISHTINLKVANFIEWTWLIYTTQLIFGSSWLFSRVSPVAVCVHQNWMVHAHWSRTNIWKLLSLFLSHRHTLSLFQKIAATAGNASGSCLSQNTQDPDSDVWRFLSYTKATYLYILQNCFLSL